MSEMTLLIALSRIPDEMILEADSEIAAKTASRGYRKRVRTLILVAVLAALALLTLISCGVYQMIHVSPIQNTKKFTYWAESTDTPEDAALALAEMYMNELMQPSEERTFYITKHRNLGVTLHPTTQLWEHEYAPAWWSLQEYEVGENKWIVEIHVEYQYEGTVSPIGPSSGLPDDYWVTILYQSSSIDFLLVKNWWGTYTLQSRVDIVFPE